MKDKGGASKKGHEGKGGKRKLRSRLWFDNPDNPGMTALYIERYLNFGLTPAELRSGKPIIGIAQTGSDLSPCNRHHIELAKRVRDGILAAGGVPFEFPVHPIQETGKRPTAALDRNLAYLGLVEMLYGYFIDGVVLTTGCDKTTPACIMAAATVNLPAIVLSGGPMNNGWHHGERTGSGTIVWKARAELAEGKIDYEQFMEIVTSSAPSVGHCNTMGTASTMNALAEALGMSLPGCAAIPGPHRERGQIAYETGKRIVDMVWEDLKPSDILTREALENAIVVNSAIGGSTNAPIHINAIARHIGVKLDIEDWEKVGHEVPLLVNMQPAGKYLGEEFHRAGGVPAVVNELMKKKLVHEDALTVNGKTIGENCQTHEGRRLRRDLPDRQADEGGRRLHRAARQPVRQRGDEDERDRRRIPQALSLQPEGPRRVRGPRDRVRRAGGLPPPHRGSRAEDRRALHAVHPRHGADRLSRRRGSREHAAAGRADQEGRATRCPASATGASPAPRARPRSSTPRPKRRRAAGSRLLKTGDKVRIDLKKRTANILISDGELAERRAGAAEASVRVPREPDALAANPARHGRPVRRGHGAEAGGEVPAARADRGRAQGQPLTAAKIYRA